MLAAPPPVVRHGASQLRRAARQAATLTPLTLPLPGFDCFQTVVGGQGVLWHSTMESSCKSCGDGDDVAEVPIGGKPVAPRHAVPLPALLVGVAGMVGVVAALARVSRR